jgi:hypothetical protein
MVTSGFIERLAAAGIGGTLNFYRDGGRAARLRERLAVRPGGAAAFRRGPAAGTIDLRRT